MGALLHQLPPRGNCCVEGTHCKEYLQVLVSKGRRMASRSTGNYHKENLGTTKGSKPWELHVVREACGGIPQELWHKKML